MAATVLPFERPIVELLARVREVRALAEDDQRFVPKLRELEAQVAVLAREFLAKLTPMQKVQLSRHANRPYTLDYLERLFTDWIELKGDRRYAEDESIIGGLARYHGNSVVLIGHQKGRGTKQNMRRNFGMPHPEGYRKAGRLFELAGKYNLPIITFIDTPGAYPGIGAEERGQSEAIGANLAIMARAKVPIVAVIIGEGGSGGALALGVANYMMVLEFGCYSVISPEGCASILWRDGTRGAEAAEQLKITARDLHRLGVVNEVVEEPPGGAHQDWDAAAALVDESLQRALVELSKLSGEQLADHRYERFRVLGQYVEGADA